MHRRGALVDIGNIVRRLLSVYDESTAATASEPAFVIHVRLEVMADGHVKYLGD